MNRKDIDEIICATDADREGECIFRYVYKLIGCKKSVKRLWVSSLEESAIKSALSSMKSSSEYDSLYSAGFCRLKADWIVIFELYRTEKRRVPFIPTIQSALSLQNPAL